MMRPVKDDAGKGSQYLERSKKKSAKSNADKARQVRRDVDSSEESVSEESSEKSRKPVPTITAKQPPKKKRDELDVAPNSTTYKKETSTEPDVCAYSKRAAFRAEAKHDRKRGVQGRHRTREVDLKGNHPELTNLQQSQRKKDLENIPTRLDPAKLLEKAKAANGDLEVGVINTKDALALAAMLKANPAIKSLRLRGDFGGPSGRFGLESRSTLHLLALGDAASDLLDDQSFRYILDACEHVHTLNLMGCHLTSEGWRSLADCLRSHKNLSRLELGGDDNLSDAGTAALASAFASGNSSISELVIDKMFMHPSCLLKLVKGLSEHKQFTLIKLQNISSISISLNSWSVEDLFQLCAANPQLKYLSMAGTRSIDFSPANDTIYLLELITESSVLSPAALDFKRHNSLRILDVTGCDLTANNMTKLASAVEGNTTLLDLRLEGNRAWEADCAKLRATTNRNIESLAKQAGAGLDLLIRHAASQVDTWPPELIEVLIQNTPPEVLQAIAAVIAPDPNSSVTVTPPTHTDATPPDPTSSLPSKPQ